MRLQKSDYEFQMLHGVKIPLRKSIVADGHRLRVYVPFGEHWYAYSMRRFQENPRMARYVLRSSFRGVSDEAIVRIPWRNHGCDVEANSHAAFGTTQRPLN